MRFALLALVTFAPLLLGGCVSPKIERAWCAVADMGGNNVMSECRFHSFDECRAFVTGGNRGFCQRNPRFRART